jgi:predicted NAD/FAD-binding protein
MAEPLPVSRREVLRSIAVAAGMPALARAAGDRRSVGIIGGGMAGVSLAWLLDGQRDVVLLESRPSVGGNVQTIDVDLDGQTVAVDIGAQYFHPGPYPLYTALLTSLGLYPSGDPEGTHAFPASITVTGAGEAIPRFVSPVVPERAWPLIDPSNWDALVAFGVTFSSAKLRESLGGRWSLTLDEWLQTLGLSVRQREQFVLPWAASLFSGRIDDARRLSARAAMIFAAKALPANALDPILYNVLKGGMIEVLRRLLDQCSTVDVMTGARVQHVSRLAGGGFTIHCADGRTATVDDLVFASSGPATWQLLQTLPGTEYQRAALGGIEFHAARLALHTDPIYAPPQPAAWSFLNCAANGPYCEASMWMERVLGVPPAVAGQLWKSWVTHRDTLPAEIVHQVEFVHMLPTPESINAQNLVKLLQGRNGVWLAGGYLYPYDSQETALRSAVIVALGLGITTARSQQLAALG